MVFYLSGPISGIADYQEKFLAAKMKMLEKGFDEIINPALMSAVLNKSAEYENYMDMDYQLIDMADIVVQLPGWENSRGCNREYGYAYAKDKTIIQFDDLIKEI